MDTLILLIIQLFTIGFIIALMMDFGSNILSSRSKFKYTQLYVVWWLKLPMVLFKLLARQRSNRPRPDRRRTNTPRNRNQPRTRNFSLVTVVNNKHTSHRKRRPKARRNRRK